ncbi:LLM class flavin-dependent oxidoreductase [Lactobacillus porci]|uniref:LLM class flavin-dependent oxidoreductase n=1 Tax=Lactobacillus porci TaxID=2012477 RepID=UPI003994220A
MAEFDASELKIPKLQILGKDTQPLFADAKGKQAGGQFPPALATHPGFSRVFHKGRLTFGLMAPFKGYPDTPVPDISDLIKNAKLAEEAGFAALWMRDIPFYDPYFGDVGQGQDPIALLGALVGQTTDIALGTAGLIIPERHPIHVAQAAATLEIMSRNRFMLGLVSGDRKSEYKNFGRKWDERGEVFKEGWGLTKSLLENPTGTHFSGNYYSNLNGTLDFIPRLDHQLPMIAIGRCRQDLDWLANKADAWIWHGVAEDETAQIVAKLQDLNQDGYWHPFGYQNFVELLEDPDAPCQLYNKIYLRGGAKSLAQFWKQQCKQGLSHVIISLKPSSRPAEDCIRDLHDYVFDEVNQD